MVDVYAYDRVIAEIYEAALVPERWSSALTLMIAEFAPRDWEVAFLLWERYTPPMGRFLGTAGVNPLAHDIYINNFAGQNEWSTASRRMRVGEVLHSDDLISRSRFFKASFYKDFLAHFGYGVAIIGMLDRHGPDQLGLVLPGPTLRDAGDLPEAVRMLLPHFRRSARISRRIQEADLRAATAESLIDNSPYAVFALGPDMQLLIANSSAQRLLAAGDVVAEQNGRLITGDPMAQQELIGMSIGKGSERTFSLSITDAVGRQHIFTALAISNRLTGEMDNAAGGASLMLIGGQRIGVSGELVAQIEQSFGLTAAEARLAGHVLEGAGLEGYAQDRAVSMHAARYVLKRIYAKTGVKTQAALAAMLRESPLGWGGRAH